MFFAYKPTRIITYLLYYIIHFRVHSVQPSSFISLYQQNAGGLAVLYLKQTHNQSSPVVYPLEKTLLAKSLKMTDAVLTFNCMLTSA